MHLFYGNIRVRFLTCSNANIKEKGCGCFRNPVNFRVRYCLGEPLDFLSVPQPQKLGSSRIHLTGDLQRRYDLNTLVGVGLQIDLISVSHKSLDIIWRFLCPRESRFLDPQLPKRLPPLTENVQAHMTTAVLWPLKPIFGKYRKPCYD